MNRQIGYSPDLQGSLADFLPKLLVLENDERVCAFQRRRFVCAFDCGIKLFSDLCCDRYSLKPVIGLWRKIARFPQRRFRGRGIDHGRRGCGLVCGASGNQEVGPQTPRQLPALKLI